MRSRILAVFICVIGFPGLAAAKGEPEPRAIFEDVTESAGIALEGLLTESLAWGDYDNDDDQDLFLSVNGSNRLFRNDGNSNEFTDVTDDQGVGGAPEAFSVGAAFGDLDNDGDLDLYVVNFQNGLDYLYENEGEAEDYEFTLITDDAGVTLERSSRGVLFVDYDHDGLLDIYVVSIGDYMLYHNEGDLTFVDVAPLLGVTASSQGVGAIGTDLDGNGWVDIYTGNRSGQLSSVFMNYCGGMEDVAVPAGVTAQGLGMGILSFDYDNDLDMDLYWTAWPGSDIAPVSNALYQNQGDGSSYVEVASAAGVLDTSGWGISCNAGDIDNDGWQDFFVTNGFSDGSSPNVLFINDQDGTFSDITDVVGGADFDGRGVAFADFDNDGRLDLVITGDTDAPNQLWHNISENSNDYLILQLEGTVSNRSAIGAWVEVTVNGNTYVQEVSGGAGRGSFNSLPLEFGFGEATGTADVTIRWPYGHTQTVENIALNQYRQIEESDPGDFEPPACECFNDADNCHAQASCTDDPGGFICECFDGFTGNGVDACEDIDECDTESPTHNCDDNATCSNGFGTFSCACDDGWEGTGVECVNIDECDRESDDCHDNATCEDTQGSFTCTCDDGFSGSGTECADIDECDTESPTHNCSENATCANIAGDFTCTCNDGFEGDGQECSLICGNAAIDDGETCDPAITSESEDYVENCRDDCTYCGDAALDENEDCDSGITDTEDPDFVDACRLDCSIAVCGDGILDDGEACDDGDTDADDGCDASCAVEVGWTCSAGDSGSVCSEDEQPSCGDGELADDEDCEDDNNDDGDGCDANCAIEDGWDCSAEDDGLSDCQTVCGDGIVAGEEGCDDDGTAADDGCNGECGIEDGWLCTGEPSECSAEADCGDGSQDEGEACDDGNDSDGDGCADCAVENGYTCDASGCVADSDLDGVPDASDNCPDVSNADQADRDEDGIGDVCDPDIDNDGLNNDDEEAAGTDPFDPDTDGDGQLDGVDIEPLNPNVSSAPEEGCGCQQGSASGAASVVILFGLLAAVITRRRRVQR